MWKHPPDITSPQPPSKGEPIHEQHTNDYEDYTNDYEDYTNDYEDYTNDYEDYTNDLLIDKLAHWQIGKLTH
ncbi:hypothetical protein [Capnocytophaga leadbetteri]